MLEVFNVSKKFDKTEVLKNINISMQQGEIISLLGKSGSGKSTILNIIAGFEEADSGSCIYNKKTIFSRDVFCEPQDRHIGFVFQNYALFPHLNIAKNIAFGISGKSRQYQKERVIQLLTLMNMSGMENKYPHQISGGQQQRIAMARVLARDSELILFDEAFSSIDSTLKSKIMTEIKEIIKSNHKTAIFVTHCPKEAFELSDKIAYIENGEIIQYDTPVNICKNPSTESISKVFSECGILL